MKRRIRLVHSKLPERIASRIYVCGGRFRSQSAFAPIPEIVEVLAASLAPPERERWFTAIVNCNKVFCSGTAAATAFMSRHISATACEIVPMLVDLGAGILPSKIRFQDMHVSLIDRVCGAPGVAKFQNLWCAWYGKVSEFVERLVWPSFKVCGVPVMAKFQNLWSAWCG